MSNKNWLAGVTGKEHAQFADKAHKAGMSTVTFSKGKKAKPKRMTAKQVGLAAAAMKAKKPGKKIPVKHEPWSPENQ